MTLTKKKTGYTTQENTLTMTDLCAAHTLQYDVVMTSNRPHPKSVKVLFTVNWST